MSNKRKSFLIHIDSLDILDELSDEQAGMLFRAIKAHHKGEEITLDAVTKIAFSPFKNQFIRDDEKYQITCAKRAEAGSKGGKQKVANASNSKQKVANLADSDNKNKSDSDNKKEKLDFSPLAFSIDEIKEFKALRAKKKAAITQRVINDHAKQFNLSRKRGYSNDDILSEWSNRGWTAYKDDWMKIAPSKPLQQQVFEPVDQESQLQETLKLMESLGND